MKTIAGFRVGDIVRVKHRKEFAEEFGGGSMDIDRWDRIENGFNERMDIFLGETGKILSIEDLHYAGAYKIHIRFLDDNLNESAKLWAFSGPMLVKKSDGIKVEGNVKKYFSLNISKKLRDII